MMKKQTTMNVFRNGITLATLLGDAWRYARHVNELWFNVMNVWYNVRALYRKSKFFRSIVNMCTSENLYRAYHTLGAAFGGRHSYARC